MPSLQNKNLTSSDKQRGAGRLGLLIVLTVWLAALGAAAANRQNIYDWWQLRNYQAPAEIEQLASQDTMTGYGRRVFYVNKPTLSDKSDFSSACHNNGGEQTIVLGCYHGGQSGIYLLKVRDKRLDGVEQVTAAHEMLHAAYERLGKDERTKINHLLQDYYNTQLRDNRVRRVIELYKKTEPKDVVNEMHSVFGSEIAHLPAPLEVYYKRYFSNRPRVAAFAAQYQAEFSKRKDEIARYDQELTMLKAQIDAAEADLNSRLAEINRSQQELMALRRSNLAAYNSRVPAFNALVAAYNQKVQEVKSLIFSYNQLVNKRNAVALEEDSLIKELTPHLNPINQ